jgi:hypothetical protein
MKKAPTATSSGDVTLCSADRFEALTDLRGGEYRIINTAGYDFGNDRWRRRSCGYKTGGRAPLLYQVEAGHDALDPTVTPAGTGDLL